MKGFTRYRKYAPEHHFRFRRCSQCRTDFSVYGALILVNFLQISTLVIYFIYPFRYYLTTSKTYATISTLIYITLFIFEGYAFHMALWLDPGTAPQEWIDDIDQIILHANLTVSSLPATKINVSSTNSSSASHNNRYLTPVTIDPNSFENHHLPTSDMPPHSLQETEQDQIDDPPIPDELEGIMFCSKCQRLRPPRAHHCSTCGKCQLMMDHHCPWIANCVGQQNHKHFVLFLFYTCILAVWHMIMLINSMNKYSASSYNYIHLTFLILDTIIMVVLTLGAGGLLIQHLYFGFRNCTELEFMQNSSKPPYDTHNIWKNWKAFFGRNWWSFLLPFTMSVFDNGGLLQHKTNI
ncbi:putative Palmitoyltransferase PFA3 [Blattamonas nauphoetae]|uniref:Palmitoyltransferase n=1 Tax=Blattamonas nauphoetae TaxID=2049346 RepID=A0ABQ9X6M8_9EUKA|nr:putative Palmitoyltransferase PFA3 [Blattamonas nauphoetae]